MIAPFAMRFSLQRLAWRCRHVVKQLLTIVVAALFVDMANVRFDRVLGNAQAFGNIGNVPARCKQAQHVHLSIRQPASLGDALDRIAARRVRRLRRLNRRGVDKDIFFV